MGAKPTGAVIKDYRRVGDDGAALRRPRRKRSPARSAAQKRAETRYGRSPKARAKDARRRARQLAALPALTAVDHLRINALYAEAARRTAETGIVHHVDHDVPLALGGAHHPDNLLVVPAKINIAKGARYASTWEFISS